MVTHVLAGVASARSGAVRLAVALCFFLGPGELSAQTQPLAGSPVLRPHYRAGDTVAFEMRGINEGRSQAVHYEAHAKGIVQQDPAGTFFEEFAWTDVSVEGRPTALSAASAAFRQRLSLAPDYPIAIPGLAQVQPILIGPITDLLTFYADVRIAMRYTNLIRAGDHAYFAYGMPSSWADGTYTLIGEDVVDFDIILQGIDPKTQTATILVRHVPPPQLKAKLPAGWMRAPVGAFPNNWVEVQKQPGGKYSAEVGQETFDDVIRFSLSRGTIVSATMDNPVDVLERDCDDQSLTMCGAAVRYRIRRTITLNAE